MVTVRDIRIGDSREAAPLFAVVAEPPDIEQTVEPTELRMMTRMDPRRRAQFPKVAAAMAPTTAIKVVI